MKWLASADNAQRSVAPTIGRHRRMLPKLETIALATIKEDCTRQRDLVNEKTTIKSKDIVAATIKATDALIASQNEIRRKLEREPFDPSGVKEEDDDISLVSGISLGQISDHLLEEVLEGNEGKIMGMEEIHSDLYTEPSDSIPQSYDSYESIFDLNTDSKFIFPNVYIKYSFQESGLGVFMRSGFGKGRINGRKMGIRRIRVSGFG